MLVNVPLVNQLDEPTLDGGPDEAAQSNCVPACLASALMCLTGRVYDGDELRDAVYGEGSGGGTDPARYGAYMTAQGVPLQVIYVQTGAELVSYIRTNLGQHKPVTGAIPSMWGNDYTGQDMVHYAASTHEVLWCDDDGANLTAMNPWGGFYQTQPYAWWAERIVYGRVFIIEGQEHVSWVKQADGTGRDSVGHACGTGVMYYLDTHGLTSVDGTMSEITYTPGQAFLPLVSGVIVRAALLGGNWTFDANGAAVLGDIWAALQAELAKPAGTPLDLASLRTALGLAAQAIAHATTIVGS